jgi:hypothetical protein
VNLSAIAMAIGRSHRAVAPVDTSPLLQVFYNFHQLRDFMPTRKIELLMEQFESQR